MNEDNILVLFGEKATRLFKDKMLIPIRLLADIGRVSTGIDCKNIFYKTPLLTGYSEKLIHCFHLILKGISVDGKKNSKIEIAGYEY